MKKMIIAIALLLSSVNLVNGASWAETFQEYLAGAEQPAAAVASKPEVAAIPAINTADSSSVISQFKENIPAIKENIERVVAKFDTVQNASNQGFFSGLKAAFNIDSQTAQSFAALKDQANLIVDKAKELLNSSDAGTREEIKGLLRQIAQTPGFAKFVEYIKSMPFTGKLSELNQLIDQSESVK